jgi:uncharacterized protein (UPF0332 family)
VKEFSKKRFARARDAIEAARRDLAADEAPFAAGHLYYAMFYIAEGLLAGLDLGFSSHGAVHGAFGKHFAKTGTLDPQYHRWLLDAFEERQAADYGIDPDISVERVEELIARAEAFLAAARAHLGSDT